MTKKKFTNLVIPGNVRLNGDEFVMHTQIVKLRMVD